MSNEKYQRFLELHQSGNPLLLGNAWNVPSARLLESAGYKAIATSSMAVAESMGYQDGEEIGFEELLYIAKRICSSTELPVSVDLEKGYARDEEELYRNIDQLLELGVVGINIEDSTQENGVQKLLSADQFAEKIQKLRSRLEGQGSSLFINARTDGYLLNLPEAFEETVMRAKKYEAAGASGIFVPFIQDLADLRKIVESTTLPVNVLALPGVATNSELSKLGVRRISLGTRFYKLVYSHAVELLEQLRAE